MHHKRNRGIPHPLPFILWGKSPLHLPASHRLPLPHMKKGGPMAGGHGSGHPDRGISFNGVSTTLPGVPTTTHKRLGHGSRSEHQVLG